MRRKNRRLTLDLIKKEGSAMKKSIIPEKGAKPIGPYSPGIQAENMLFVSRQTGNDLYLNGCLLLKR